MDSKTIKAAVLDLEKASDGETILTILNRLKEGVQATEQLLRVSFKEWATQLNNPLTRKPK